MHRAATILAFALVGGAASAQEAATAGRYAFAPVEAGVLRLDTQTGRVALCAETGGTYSCAPVQDEVHDNDRSPENVERLDALEARIEAIEERGVLFPDSESLDRAGVLAERMMMRLFDMVGEMRRDFEDDSP